MDVESIKKYEGERVLLILKNNYKFTAIMPKITGDSFSIKDKFNNDVTISCDFIEMIIKKDGDNNE